MKYPIGTKLRRPDRKGYVWTITGFSSEYGYSFHLDINGIPMFPSADDNMLEEYMDEIIENNEVIIDLSGITSGLVSDYLKNGSLG